MFLIKCIRRNKGKWKYIKIRYRYLYMYLLFPNQSLYHHHVYTLTTIRAFQFWINKTNNNKRSRFFRPPVVWPYAVLTLSYRPD